MALTTLGPMATEGSRTPIDPHYAARVRDSFARQPFMGLIGAWIENVGAGICEVGVDRRSDLLQQHGYIHGAVISALCDNAGAYAAFTLMPSDVTLLAVEYKVHFLAPASGDRLIARGRVIRPGRTLSVSHVDVVTPGPQAERLVAVSINTVLQLSERPDRPHAPPSAPPPGRILK